MGKSLVKGASTLLASGLVFSTGIAVETQTAKDAAGFEQKMLPLLEAYCYKCHGEEGTTKGDLDLMGYRDKASLLEDRKLWLLVLEQIETEEMPTKEPLPTVEERAEMVAWLEHALNDLDWEKLRDAGHVTLPRLTKVEYNHTMRDLLGVDLPPGAEFGEDAEGLNGFTTDRDGLFVTPAQMEKYFAAAEGAIEGLMALRQDPTRQLFEAEEMYMTATSMKTVPFPGGGVAYGLNRGQMTLYDAVEFAAGGIYEFRVRAAAPSAPSGARLRINDVVKGEFAALDAEPQVYSMNVLVPKGTHQVAFNIEKPAVDRYLAQLGKAEREKRMAPAEPVKHFRALPKSANATVTKEAEKRALRFPASRAEAADPNLAKAIKELNTKAYSLQRPYEWLRLLDTDGHPNEMVRFRGYVDDRSKEVELRLKRLAELLEVEEDAVRARWKEGNQVRIEDQEFLYNRVRDVRTVAAKPNKKRDMAKRGDIQIDWIEIVGPLPPEGGIQEEVFLTWPSEEVSEKEASRHILGFFVSRAFRRQVDNYELERYWAVFDQLVEEGADFEEAIKHSLAAVLVSPHFLFRNELAPPGEKGREFALDSFQIASRLSYFLWSSMPDQELFLLADSDRLRHPRTLREQVRRMLRDPKAAAFLEAFPGQWLGYGALGKSVFPDEKEFSEFDTGLLEAMKAEISLSFLRIFTEGGSLLDLIDSDQTFLNDRLALHYGVEGVHGASMQPVQLTDPNRGGLLGSGAVLTATSSPVRTSPVLRGKWVLETLLGQHIPEPPADAGELPPNAAKKKNTTLREELERHRDNPDCKGCHEKIDPIGFGLENFDAIGRFRSKEPNGKPIDNVGELPGGVRFQGAAELKTYLLEHRKEEFVRNVSERLLAYALGQEVKTFDEAALRQIVDRVTNADYDGATLIEEVVLSYPFLHQNESAPEIE